MGFFFDMPPPQLATEIYNIIVQSRILHHSFHIPYIDTPALETDKKNQDEVGVRGLLVLYSGALTQKLK